VRREFLSSREKLNRGKKQKAVKEGRRRRGRNQKVFLSPQAWPAVFSERRELLANFELTQTFRLCYYQTQR
jgi:hypothetical protein